MSASSIPVDLFNPGQVFACLGLMEIAQALFGHASGRFDDGDPRDVRFELHSDGTDDAIGACLDWLSRAELTVLVPAGRADELRKWKLPTREHRVGEPYPVSPPDKPAPMPAELRADGVVLDVNSWADETGRDKAKWWAGMAGYPGAGLLNNALELARPRLASEASDPFAIREMRSSSFRFDARGECVPSQTGFSPNQHGALTSWGFPAVDVLAAIGTQHARPRRPDPRDKLLYHYTVVRQRRIDVSLHRAALGCADLPQPTRRFELRLDWPGQENQARSITSVTEIAPT